MIFLKDGRPRSMVCLAALAAALVGWADKAAAQMYISEIYFDPPGGGGDLVFEYIELRGTANAALADHYLVFLENETSASADPGEIDSVFDLGLLSTPNLGSNGYLVLKQAMNAYPAAANGTVDLTNTNANLTWGSGPTTSSLGFTDEGANGELENSGFTAMLIRNNGGASTAPSIPSSGLIDLDNDDDGELDAGTILDSWTVLDSIGVNAEASDINGVLYAPVNFSPGTPVGGGRHPAGTHFVDVGFEIEYLARWGENTGNAPGDWHAANLTGDEGTGSNGPPDFRQSGDPHTFAALDQRVESSQGVPYGTKIVNTLGAANVFIRDGDFNPVFDDATKQFVFDHNVDGHDLLAWQRNFGFGDGLYATREHGDASLNKTVDGADYELWVREFGASHGGAVLSSVSAPEPSGCLLLSIATYCVSGNRRRGAWPSMARPRA